MCNFGFGNRNIYETYCIEWRNDNVYSIWTSVAILPFRNCVYFHANSYTVQHMIWHETRGAGISIIGGADIHIFVFCPINFFWNRLFLQSVNTNIWISAPTIIDIPAPLHETVESSNSIENELNFRVQTAARTTSKVISVNILRRYSEFYFIVTI
jgi:hypothetical protein